jgi:tetratricopeptide (TPR) repeat protein
MAVHWLRVADSPQGWDARDHIAQTIRCAAQSPATWHLAARLALRLHPAMMRAGLYASWANDLASVLERTPRTHTALALELHAALGATLMAGAQWERARVHLMLVRRAYRRRGDALGVAQANYDLACLAWNRGEWQRAVHLARNALRDLRTQDARQVLRLRSRLLDLIGLALWRMEEPHRALDYVRRALALRSRADRRGLGHLHHHLLLVFTSLGNVDAALAHAERAREFFEACGDREGLAYVWSDVSDVYRLQNDVARARDALARAYALWRELQDPAGLADFHRHLGLVEQLAGNRDVAREQLTYARALWEQLDEPREVARCEEALRALENE